MDLSSPYLLSCLSILTAFHHPDNPFVIFFDLNADDFLGNFRRNIPSFFWDEQMSTNYLVRAHQFHHYFLFLTTSFHNYKWVFFRIWHFSLFTFTHFYPLFFYPLFSFLLLSTFSENLLNKLSKQYIIYNFPFDFILDVNIT